MEAAVFGDVCATLTEWRALSPRGIQHERKPQVDGDGVQKKSRKAVEENIVSSMAVTF